MRARETDADQLQELPLDISVDYQSRSAGYDN